MISSTFTVSYRNAVWQTTTHCLQLISFPQSKFRGEIRKHFFGFDAAHRVDVVHLKWQRRNDSDSCSETRLRKDYPRLKHKHAKRGPQRISKKKKKTAKTLKKKKESTKHLTLYLWLAACRCVSVLGGVARPTFRAQMKYDSFYIYHHRVPIPRGISVLTILP